MGKRVVFGYITKMRSDQASYMENVWGDDVLFQGPSLDRRPMTFYPVVRIEFQYRVGFCRALSGDLGDNEGFERL
jgi:hypothetical protein